MKRDLLPPGEVGHIPAGDCLVIAPHFDDETLGCGGLIHQLTTAGAHVRILFLSDSSGGVEAVDDQANYAKRRKLESIDAATKLGVTDCVYLGLPDGQLVQHQSEIRQSLEKHLLDLRPNILLVPGPLEITQDHQGSFTAAFDLLQETRESDSLGSALRDLLVLFYEINHPAYPNLLLDVSDKLEVLAAAMSKYPSQQERHDYLAAGIGLRRYRTHTLPLQVQAAEAYFAQPIAELRGYSRSEFIRSVGGCPEIVDVAQGPLISVIVRTCDRPELLTQALDSLASSTYRQLEVVLVVDGAGPAPVPEDYPLLLRRVELSTRRGRSGAANAGLAAATGDFIAFLDDDDLVAPEHFAQLVAAAMAADVRVVYSDAAVVAYELQGDEGWKEMERRLPYSRDFDLDVLLVDNYLPLNTLLIDRTLIRSPDPFDSDLSFFEDWDFLIRLALETPFHHLKKVTCEYRHFRGGAHILGENPRQRSDFLLMKQKVMERYRGHLSSERLARVVTLLRQEAVEGQEAGRSLRKDRDQAHRERARFESQYHSLHGEVTGLREELPRFRGKVEEQEEHLRRVYQEIERLNDLIQTMQGTRAWRLHEWWQRRRS